MRSMLIALVPMLSIALAGCGEDLGTVPVSGKVLVDGQPQEGVLVFFKSGAPDGLSASGTTDENGEFQLTTEVNGDGALPGTYQVSVSKYESEELDVGIDGEIDMDDEAAMDAIYGALDKQGREQESKALIAAKYTKPETSGLEATVQEEGENNFTFEVSAK